MFTVYFLILFSAILFAAGVFYLFQPRPPMPINLDEINSATLASASRPVRRPAFFKLLGFLIPLNRRVVNKLGREKLENRLLFANANLLPEDFITLKAVLLILAVWLYLIVKNAFPGQGMMAGIVLIGLSLIAPEAWLTKRRKARQKVIVKVLPDVVDLLALCVNAGLDFGLAVKWIVDKSKPNPLIEELGLFLMETNVGKTRRQALQDMSKRVNLPEMSSFIRTLVQAERLGTPLESALDIIADETRDQRFRRGERQALLAPLKMLLPLIVFIMPVVGIVVAGPILLQFMSGGLPGFK